MVTTIDYISQEIMKMILNKENVLDNKAEVLDLSINVESSKFNISVYDKREHFPFEIVQFVPVNSNVSRSLLYGVFGTQIIRYFRIHNICDKFVRRVKMLINIFVKQGYDLKLLNNVYSKVCKNHKFREKFGNAVNVGEIF